jgi:beta-lactamase class A
MRMDAVGALEDLLATVARADPAALVSVVVRSRAPAGWRTVWEHHPVAPHYAASTMKLPLLLAAYRSHDAGRLDLDTAVRVHNVARSQAAGRYGLERTDDSDPEVWDRLGQDVSLRWLCRRMVVRSSNLATNLVLAEVGLDAVAAAVRATGASGVEVVRGIGDYAAQASGRANLVTADGLSRLLTAIADGHAASPATCTAVAEVLAANEVATDVRAGLPPGTWVAHKNGWVDGVVHDAALVRPDDAAPFVLTVCTRTDWPNDRAHRLVATLAATTWAHRTSL